MVVEAVAVVSDTDTAVTITLMATVTGGVGGV
jgi:hypothetical protein